MTNQATQQIIQSLEKFFQEQDAKIADSEVAWAHGRVAALAEFKESEEYETLSKKGAFGGVYDAMFAICGGKTWYNVFQGRSKTMIEEFMRKNAKATADKRNAKIVKQLEKYNITEVTSLEVGYCEDGFNGWFRFNGNRVLSIESIIAGGYNVQRMHQRVLVNLK